MNLNEWMSSSFEKVRRALCNQISITNNQVTTKSLGEKNVNGFSYQAPIQTRKNISREVTKNTPEPKTWRYLIFKWDIIFTYIV